jgi:hypothetical protein
VGRGCGGSFGGIGAVIVCRGGVCNGVIPLFLPRNGQLSIVFLLQPRCRQAGYSGEGVRGKFRGHRCGHSM